MRGCLDPVRKQLGPVFGTGLASSPASSVEWRLVMHKLLKSYELFVVSCVKLLFCCIDTVIAVQGEFVSLALG